MARALGVPVTELLESSSNRAGARGSTTPRPQPGWHRRGPGHRKETTMAKALDAALDEIETEYRKLKMLVAERAARSKPKSGA